MAESKSAALTSLATPQALTFEADKEMPSLPVPIHERHGGEAVFRSALFTFQERRKRMATQSSRDESAHSLGHPG
jgi:hypothetical protein